MTRIAIIPARGGSKRIPRKNVKEFCGRPLISYSIQAALECGLFDRVIVSTEDDEIARISENEGAEVPFKRPAELADDYAGTDDVLRHAVNSLIEEDGGFESCCCIQACAPLILPKDLVESYEIFRSNDAPALIPVTEFEYPIMRAYRISDSGGLVMMWPEHEMTRSQDLEKAYHDAGSFYWFDPGRYQEIGSEIWNDSTPYIMPAERVQDIDTEEDWRMAELLYKIHSSESAS